MAEHLRTQTTEENNITDESLRQIGDQLYNDITIKDRKYKFTNYPNVFLGSECVEWLRTKSGIATTEVEAIELGNKMIQLGIFSHCVKDHQLINGQEQRSNSRQQWRSSKVEDEFEGQRGPNIEQ
jgi:hypothetical protein